MDTWNNTLYYGDNLSIRREYLVLFPLHQEKT